MTLSELQNQALQLPVEERLQLINVLMRSIQSSPDPSAKREGLAASLIGIAKTDALPPTDEEVQTMLDDRLAQKYLS